jgi:hypothetical protein
MPRTGTPSCAIIVAHNLRAHAPVGKCLIRILVLEEDDSYVETDDGVRPLLMAMFVVART